MKLKSAAIGLLSVILGLFVTMSAHASIIQLGFILDESGSIGSGNWTTIVNGLSSAVNNIPVGGTDQYEITVVAFATNASTEVNRVLLTDATARTNVANAIAGITYLPDSYADTRRV